MADKKTRRIEQINGILEERGYVAVKALSEELNVSEMTIRRDVSQLRKLGIAEMVNGVLIRCSQSEEDKYDISSAGLQRGHEKEKIGKLAGSLIAPGDVIALDVGTTTEQIARYLPQQLDITIICYSFNILCELRKQGFAKIVFGGGYFRESCQTFESKEAVQLIKQYRINKAFISAAGISQTLGITCANGYEVSLKRAVIQSAQERILVSDSSKFGVVKAAYFADIGEFQTIITDDDLAIDIEAYYQEKNLTIYKA